MKNLLALILAAIILAAALASCAVPSTTAVDPHIRLTSSDAADAAAWLNARLGDRLTDSVVIGTNADGYGVDLTALESDGYFIRSIGGEIALFAKTADGLDRAVRKYAKAVEAGDPVADETYHEGYRVKRLTVAGNDISTYAIVRVTEDDPCVTTAATELAEYIEKTCGTKLPVCAEADFASTGAAHKIAISSGDETLGSEGFTLSVGEDGTLTVSGGVWRGALFGVYDLLEDDLGWRFVGTGFLPTDKREYLYEAGHIDLTSAINRTEKPSIPNRGGLGTIKERDTLTTKNNAKYGGFGFAPVAGHGLESNHKKIFSGEFEGVYLGGNVTGTQPCFTNEDVLEAIEYWALTSVKESLDAGKTIGKDLHTVDVGRWDNCDPCVCKSCLNVKKVEGNDTGAYLRMANRVADLLDENYPGMNVGLLVYKGMDALPRVTRPAKNIVIAYCFYIGLGYESCQNHRISGEDCAYGEMSNRLAAKYFEEWNEVVERGKVQVWYYPFNSYNVCYNAPIYDTLLDDMRYLDSFGTETVYLCTGYANNGLINEELSRYLCSKFAWDATITDEEALDLMREWFEIVYGDSGDLLYELTILAGQAGDRAGCWGSFNAHSNDRVDYAFIAENADRILSAFDSALEMADSAATETLVDKYMTGFKFMILVSRYDDMYINGTEAEREEITAFYREVWEAFRKYNFRTYTTLRVHFYAPETFDPDVHPHDWIDNSIHEKN